MRDTAATTTVLKSYALTFKTAAQDDRVIVNASSIVAALEIGREMVRKSSRREALRSILPA